MRNYIFEDAITGEQIIVEASNREGAEKSADEILQKPILLGLCSDFEAECLGLDTY